MDLSVFSDERFMGEALKEARTAYEAEEIPVGAVIVSDKRIIARAHNQTEQLHDVTAHAEMLALTSAANSLGTKFLDGCSMYVTLEPCMMCAGALAWARIGRLIFGAYDEKKGFTNYGVNVLHPKTELVKGLEQEESRELLEQFFQNLRD